MPARSLDRLHGGDAEEGMASGRSPTPTLRFTQRSLERRQGMWGVIAHGLSHAQMSVLTQHPTLLSPVVS